MLQTNYYDFNSKDHCYYFLNIKNKVIIILTTF